MKKREDLKILYIQVREDQPTRDQEFDEFIRFSELKADQFTVVNVFDRPLFDGSVMDGHDALMIGGSSDASGMETIEHPEKYPYGASIRKVFRRCIDDSIPVFASCYGYEEAATEIGGTLIKDDRNVNVGFAHIHATEEGKNDPLLKDAPDGFAAVNWHSERTDSLPDEAIVLASTDTCPHAIFKLKGKPFYAFQFHPEIDKAGLIGRLTRYITRYHSEGGLELLDTIKKTCPDVPEGNLLVKKFIDRIVLAQ